MDLGLAYRQILKHAQFLDSFSGAKEDHFFFGLMKVFAWDYIMLAFALLAQVFFEFGPPVGLNQILAYVNSRKSTA